MNLTAVKVAVQFILSLFEEIRTTGNGIMYLFCYLPRVNTAVLRHYDVIDWSCNKIYSECQNTIYNLFFDLLFFFFLNYVIRLSFYDSLAPQIDLLFPTQAAITKHIFTKLWLLRGFRKVRLVVHRQPTCKRNRAVKISERMYKHKKNIVN